MSSFLSLITLPAIAFLVSAIVTGLVRRYALRGALLDVPNERSSHGQPTPRGGGLGIVVAILLATTWLGLNGLPVSFLLGLGGGVILLAAIGWRDDHRPVPIRWRLLAHFLAAAWALAWIAPHTVQTLPQWLVLPALALGIAWVTNLYNFMDGIDGIAGAQAICTGLAGGWLLWLAGEAGLAAVSLSIAAAAAGFLCWNWPPARIFMGDVGSCVLGFAFAVLAIEGHRRGAMPLSLWIILLAPFLVDSGLTLLMRMLRRERWYLAHRSHAYQKLVQIGWSHRRVTVIFLLINIFFTIPMALMALFSPANAGWMAVVAMLAIGILWIAAQRIGAARP